MAEPADMLANPLRSGRSSAFDAHHPPSTDLINECVHCGFCLATCPTYALWGEEMDSPRGRIYLMKLASEGQVSLDSTFVHHMDNCLGCMACMTACPSGVKYDKLIEATRAQIERNYPRPKTDGILRRMIFEIFPRPDRLRLLLGPLRIFQRSGLQSLVRRSGLLKLLPASLRAMENLTPSAPQKGAALPERVPAQGELRLRVGLLLGCVQSVFFPEVNAATARVLAAEGCEVIIPNPENQGCCGALMIHAGEEKAALEYARRTIEAFERVTVDAIVINAAGCGSNMKEYGYLLRDDPNYSERAKAFSAKCRDVSEVLAALAPRAPRHPLNLKVAYQDACHLQHAQGVRVQPRTVLATIPELQICETAEAALCCGSAGIYNLVRPGPAKELGDRKVRNVLAAGPDIVATGNPGCVLQLRSGLRQAGSDVPVVHMIEIVDASIRGLSPESLLKKQ
ncbi:MAG TPA: glycolate oxidase subunit GlcF [Terriglobales bacterium]|nr:glycolate oxidase subunit GlcF [Terriglobales bacterium]